MFLLEIVIFISQLFFKSCIWEIKEPNRICSVDLAVVHLLSCVQLLWCHELQHPRLPCSLPSPVVPKLDHIFIQMQIQVELFCISCRSALTESGLILYNICLQWRIICDNVHYILQGFLYEGPWKKFHFSSSNKS